MGVDNTLPLLVQARAHHSRGEYTESAALARSALPALEEAISQGLEVGSRDIANYFLALQIEKDAHYRSLPVTDRPRRSAYVLVFNADKSRVLLAHRGAFKRLFPDKVTLTGCGHGGTSWDTARQALEADLPIQVSPERLLRVDAKGTQASFLESVTFSAITDEEWVRLGSAVRTLESRSRSIPGVHVQQSPSKRSITLFTVRRGSDITELAAQFGHFVGMPPIFHTRTSEQHTLYVYKLDSAEESRIREWAEESNSAQREAGERFQAGVDQEEVPVLAKAMDSDRWAFHEWFTLLTDFERVPLRFALDLCAPYLGQHRMIAQIEQRLGIRRPLVVGLDGSMAQSVAAVGGKTAGVHLLRSLASSKVEARPLEGKVDGWEVPQGWVVTCFAFERCVLHNRRLRGRLAQVASLQRKLAAAPGPTAREQAEHQLTVALRTLRDAIRRIELPPCLVASIRQAVHELGAKHLAVRSSSTAEDTVSRAGAGMGESQLHVPPEHVLRAIKNVWASQYAEGFVLNGLSDLSSRMAVLLQPMIETRAAGVMMTLDPVSGRHGFSISANRLPGEVVDGRDHQADEADTWFVSPDARCLLECRTGEGRLSYLTEAEVLKLAHIGWRIQESRRAASDEEHLDIEFALDGQGRFHILQARPETTSRRASADGSRTVTTVDIARLPMGVECLLLEGLDVSAGAVTGVLQVVSSTDGYHEVRPGVILVTPNTNNAWNGAFPKIRGILTDGGNMLSHAATNARECGIPAVVGVADVVRKLSPYDGYLVTLDARRKTLYIGAVPITTTQVLSSLWRRSDELLLAAEEEREREHRQRQQTAWESLQKFGQTMENALGHWLGKPRRAYGYFQLGYYRQAWEHLPRKLNTLFPDKPPIPVPIEVQVFLRVLYFPIIPGTPLLGAVLRHLTLEQHERLLLERRRVLHEADAFFTRLERIDAANVDAVVAHLVEVLACLHLAYYFHWHFARICFEPQIRYVRPQHMHDLLEIALDMQESPLATDRRSLLREKYVELAAITERIRRIPEARGLFHGPQPCLRAELPARYPEIWATIEALSNRYKHTSEDLRRVSDTEDYLQEIQHHLDSQETGEEGGGLLRVADYCAPFLRTMEGEDDRQVLARLRSEQPDLTLMLEGVARTRQMQDPIEVIPAIREILRHRDVLRDSLERYPRLCRTLTAARHEAILREDGHQWITRMQRRLNPMMLEHGHRAVAEGVLTSPEEVFDLSPAEFVGLVRGPSRPDCLRWTAERILHLEAAQQLLAPLDTGTVPKESGGAARTAPGEQARREVVDAYERALAPVFRILETQRDMACSSGDFELGASYLAEHYQLKADICRLRDLAQGDGTQSVRGWPQD